MVLDTMVANGALSKAEAEEAHAQAGGTRRVRRPLRKPAAGLPIGRRRRRRSSRARSPETSKCEPRWRRSCKNWRKRPSKNALAEYGASSRHLAGGTRRDAAGRRGGRDGRRPRLSSKANSTAPVRRIRQPGSAFKLFVYLAALRNGYRPSDTIEAAPMEIDGWEPENFGGEPVRTRSRSPRPSHDQSTRPRRGWRSTSGSTR